MNHEPRILPECYADTLLIEIIMSLRPQHMLSIGEVANKMEHSLKNQKAFGLIDDDKRKPNYIHLFQEIEHDRGLSLRAHPTRPHYVTVVSPAFEQWIWTTAEDLNIDASKYGFKNYKQFKNATKSQNVRSNQNVKNFLNTLKQKKNSPLKTLQNWIKTHLAIH